MIDRSDIEKTLKTLGLVSGPEEDKEIEGFLKGMREDGVSPAQALEMIRQEQERRQSGEPHPDDEAKLELADWLRGSFRLQKASGSNLHKLQEALSVENAYLGIVLQTAESFVVEHDWAAAFTGATDFDGPFKLPYDSCAFDFVVSGRPVIAVAEEDDTGVSFTLAVLVRKNLWFRSLSYRWVGGKWAAQAEALPAGSAPESDSLAALIGAQIKAICVALDAQVATQETIRAPSKLVAARLRRGKIPPVSYHVVSLARKPRAAPLPEHSSSGRRVRLHFRRGHWRHFETHKTWIKWMLVGDPDLGFIEKHYKL